MYYQSLKKCLLIFLAIFIFTANTTAVSDTQPTASTASSYVIVIDAGSSGSRIHVFNYQLSQSSEIKTINEVSQLRVTPGVTGFLDQPSKLTGYFSKIFKKANSLLSTKIRSETPVYLFATAGVRDLKPDQQQKIMNAVRSAIQVEMKRSGYQIPLDPKQHFKIIKGEDEALFGWLSVNYSMHRLNDISLKRLKTYGVLDMGGVSAEVTFQTEGGVPLDHDNGFLYGKNRYLIYSYSYGTYGLNKAMQLMLAKYGNQLSVCFQKGVQFPMDESPVVKAGAGDFNQCQQFISHAIYDTEKQNACAKKFGEGLCSKMGIYQPDIQGVQFIGISKYYGTFSVLGLADEVASLQQLAKQGQLFCRGDWSTIKKQFSNEDPKILSQQCFRSAWIAAFLQGIGFSSKTPFIVTDKITGSSSDWPLGATIFLLTQTK